MSDILRFLSWYLAILVVGLVSFPIAFRFLSHLPSKGYALARPLGLLIWGYVFWLLCSLGILQNNTGGVLVAFLLLLAASIWSCSKGRWHDLVDWFKANKKTIITMEVLFFVAFGIWTVIRAANPDAAYTEKPMELAFINSILRSPTFPPNDPWLSGYAISYYYFGYVLVSMLIRVTGVASSIAFNLSSSLWFGLTALAAYGIVFDLLASRKRPTDDKGQKHLNMARTGGFLGPFFILIASCLEGVLEFFYSWQLFWKPGAQGTLVSRFWTWLSVNELDVPPTQPFSWFPNRPSSWLWWRGSRVIQDLNLAGGKIEIIDEFPFFSYLLADLHPHVLAMPFVLLAVGICLNVFLNRKSIFTLGGSIFGWLKRWEFWVISLALGSLAFINTWDFPIYVGLFCIVVVFVRIKEHGWGWIRIWEFLKTGLIIGITGVVLFLPFFMGFKSQAGGFLPSMEYMTRGVHFWILFGALLIPIVIWLIFQFRRLEKPRRFFNGFLIGVVILSGLLLLSLLYGIFILNANQTATLLVASKSHFFVSLGQKLLAANQAFINLHGSADARLIVSTAMMRRLVSPGTWVTLLLMFTAIFTLLYGKNEEAESLPEIYPVEVEPSDNNFNQTRNFVCLLLLMGVVLIAVPEFFYLRDNFGNRMNTIFKFYFEAWILWGVVAAYASVELLTRLKGFKFWLFIGVWIVTIGGGLAYPAVMLWNKTEGFHLKDLSLVDKSTAYKWTLDGNAYLGIYYQDDYAAIQWLSQEPLGIVAEAIGGGYTDFARVSTRTGMPTVLGWEDHEYQWGRSNVEIGSRVSDIKKLYTTQDWTTASEIIRRYNIRYIFLGNMEKNLYQTDGHLLVSNLPVIYANNSVSIFEVPDEKGETTP